MSEPRSEELHKLVADYLDRLNSGDSLDYFTILSDHPEIGPDIIEKLEAFIQLDSPPVDNNEPLGTLGDYTLRRQIGRGGMGVVYEAWENSMDRAVALKVLPSAIAADSRATTRFLREAQTAGKLNHPNVVGVYSTGVKEGTPWYAMEYVDGETLAQILARTNDAESETDTPFGKKDDVAYFGKLARAFADVADGLQHAHSKGVTHRDIKPSNLILDSDGRLRILDFGLARLEGQDSLTISGDVVGTPLYMSPEQARRRTIPIDHRTDVYSLGATVYEVICGRPPFRGKDHADTLSQIIERDPVDPRKINPQVPKDLETIVLKCLRKDSGDRYGTAEALGQDLRRFVRGDPIEARPRTQLENWAAAARFHRQKLMAGTGVLVLFSLTVTLAFLIHIRHEEANRRHENAVTAEYERVVNDSTVLLELAVIPADGGQLDGEAVSLGLLLPGDLRQVRPDFASEHIESILADLDRAADLLPHRPEAHVLRSRTLWVLGRNEEAHAVLDRALEENPEFLPALVYRSQALRRFAGQPRAQEFLVELSSRVRRGWERLWLDSHLAALDGKWGEVDRAATQLLRWPGDDPYVGFSVDVRLKRGRAALQAQEYWSAVEDFVHIRDRWPSADGPALLLSSAYYLTGERRAAHRAIDEVVADNPTAALTAVGVLQHFRDHEKLREVIDTISDAAIRNVALARMFASSEPEKAIAAAREAIRLGKASPSLFDLLFWASMDLRRLEEARSYAEEGLGLFPENKRLTCDIGWYYHYVSKPEEALLHMQKALPLPTAYSGLGACYWHLGAYDKALAAYDESIARYPRHFYSYYRRSYVSYYVGNLREAVDHGVRSLVLGAFFYNDILFAIYSPETLPLFEPHWDRIRAATDQARRRGIDSPSLRAFAALSLTYGPRPDLDKALDHATIAVQQTKQLDAMFLAYLADVYHARGEIDTAIRTLERAVDVPHRWAITENLLRRYREEALPVLVSCASVDDLLTRPTGNPWARLLPIVKQRSSESEGGSDVVRYIEARRFEAEGHLDAAARVIEEVLQAGLEEQAAILRLAKLRASLGRSEEAIRLIEDFLFRGTGTTESWSLWLSLASEQPEFAAGALLERSPFRNRDGSGTETSPVDPFGQNVHWLLSELSQKGEVRIDCGAKQDYVDTEGRLWSRDRFYDGGLWPNRYATPPIENTREPNLYLEHRWWFKDAYSAPGYRIPLPNGRYELVLHFCRTVVSPARREHRVVDVLCEDRVILEDFDQGGGEIGAVDVQRFEVTVKDGCLDLVFRLAWRAYLAGIELRRL